MGHFSVEMIMDWVLEWLVSGNLHVEMLSNHFQFSSPFWKTSSKDHFIDKFKNSTTYQETSLANIVKFDPVIKLKGLDGNHFAIVLQYHTKNGHKVYETVLGTVEQGLLTELRSIYDLSETKKALQIS
ncbi:MAG: hypothetical protein K2Y01_02320 [Rhabdochlamydiaceae bacterium]|nr:hypothetical protein [Rhabdochlamydiaceae bacterium]